MKLGYAALTAFVFDLDAAFKLADELKLDFVELSADLQEIEPKLQPVKRVRELSQATGLGTTVHLSYIDLNLASLSPAARATSVARITRGLDYAAEIGASCAVLHSGRHYYRHPLIDDLAYRGATSSLAELRNPAVPVTLENLAVDAFDLIREPEGLRELTETAGFSNCLDFGHAHIESRQPWRTPEKQVEDLIARYIETLGDKIIHLHLHNNDGSLDQHLPTPQGGVDYSRYLGFLRKFTGTACLEVATGEGGVRESVRHIRGLLDGLTAAAD
jgi:sugar phosphate isomerase/epimerase